MRLIVVSIVRVQVDNIKECLPKELQLDNTSGAGIPGFSPVALNLFSRVNPENAAIGQLSHYCNLVDDRVKTLEQLTSNLKEVKKGDLDCKIFTLVVLAVSIGIIVAGCVGIGLTFAFPTSLIVLLPCLALPIGLFLAMHAVMLVISAFQAVPKAEKKLYETASQSNENFCDYQINLQKFLLANCEFLTAKIKLEHEKIRQENESLVGFAALREENIANMNNCGDAIAGLDALTAFYGKPLAAS